jgi:hypothetical protein
VLIARFLVRDSFEREGEIVPGDCDDNEYVVCNCGSYYSVLVVLCWILVLHGSGALYLHRRAFIFWNGQVCFGTR